MENRKTRCIVILGCIAESQLIKIAVRKLFDFKTEERKVLTWNMVRNRITQHAQDHEKVFYPTSNPTLKVNTECSLCKKLGHTADKCFRKKKNGGGKKKPSFVDFGDKHAVSSSHLAHNSSW
jgi:hypothetical protein